ncbi:ATP-dependent Clp protease ATP-binding subunit [Patescibacteria group bacterium]|nr:ATP-dependent Clp protease ATP-binding subunit [Patescibacteria group bacterium]
MNSSKPEDSLLKLSKNAIKAINESHEYAIESKSRYLDLKHLFLAIVNQKDNLVAKAFENANYKFPISFEHIGDIIGKNARSNKSDIIVTDAYITAIIEAFYMAREFNHVYVGVEHLFLSILRMDSHHFVSELKKYGLDQEVGYNLIWNYANYPPGLFLYPKEDINSLKISTGRTILDNLATNLSAFGEETTPKSLIGREKEIERIIHILSRRNKNNPMIIGEAGIGKTALVEFLAYKIHKKEVPENLLHCEVWSLDISKLMMSTEMRGELEGKISMLMEEIKQRGNIVLFIDEIHMIFNSSGPSSNNDIANILKPHLTSDKFRCIGATTLFEYQRFFESDTALNRRFLTVNLKELSVEDSIKAIESIKADVEKFHNVKIYPDALESAVQLSNRYIVDRFLPDKAIDVLEEASTIKGLEINNQLSKTISNIKFEIQKVIKKKEEYVEKGQYVRALNFKYKERELNTQLSMIADTNIEHKVVTSDDIVNVVSNWSGIPIYSIKNNDISSINKVESELRKEIIGQDNALDRVMNFLKSARAGFRDPSKPIAKFLFLGPTGVGKTELAKQIAIKYMGSVKSLIQIDMSEYMEAHSVSKFIGSPPGYVGYQEGGRLTENVKNKPYSVVLFDEIEKAHPDVLNILLQIMEEGHLTDSRGRFVNFKNTIIVMTSNIGSDIIENNSVLGFDIDINKSSNMDIRDEYDRVEDETMLRLKEYLLPEFINRIDDIIIFRSLNKSDALKIVKKLAVEYSSKISHNNIKIKFSNEFYRFIVERGFNEEFGVRQLKRLFDKYAETTLANFFISNPDIKLSDTSPLQVLMSIDSHTNDIEITQI